MSRILLHPLGDPPRNLGRRKPLAALVAQLQARVGQGEDSGAVLDDVHVRQPSDRAAYLAAAGLPPEEGRP